MGEVSKETVALLLKKRGRLAGNKKLTDEYIQKIGYKSLDALAEAIASCKAEYQKLPNVQLFSSCSSSKGFKENRKAIVQRRGCYAAKKSTNS